MLKRKGQSSLQCGEGVWVPSHHLWRKEAGHLEPSVSLKQPTGKVNSSRTEDSPLPLQVGESSLQGIPSKGPHRLARGQEQQDDLRVRAKGMLLSGRTKDQGSEPRQRCLQT